MRILRKIKIKYILIPAALLVVLVLSIVAYYRFDPSVLTDLSFYINLANPSMRIVRVREGLRKEEVASVVGDELNWNSEQEKEFIGDANIEGHYFPKTYLVYAYDTPSEVRATMLNEFGTQLNKVQKPPSKQIINQQTALTIASIIQREAAGTNDMRLISGIIWNRIFKGMKLQMDATLQYAKGNEENGWWPKVTPADLKINSSYNTYLYTGLPPGAIANPGLAAITAAYNPQKTDCLFYLHDRNREIHCAKTYAEHLKNIDIYLK